MAPKRRRTKNKTKQNKTNQNKTKNNFTYMCSYMYASRDSPPRGVGRATCSTRSHHSCSCFCAVGPTRRINSLFLFHSLSPLSLSLTHTHSLSLSLSRSPSLSSSLSPSLLMPECVMLDTSMNALRSAPLHSESRLLDSRFIFVSAVPLSSFDSCPFLGHFLKI